MAMIHLSERATFVLKHPTQFARQTLHSFSANQCALLAAAIAYYTLLSVVPLLIVSIIGLSHFVDQAELLGAVARYLEWLVPSQSKAVLADVSGVLENRMAIGAVLLGTMLFFSSLAFSVVEKAMAVIFAHRKLVTRRSFLVTAILPYSFVLLLCIALLTVTLISIALQALSQESFHLLDRDWSLGGLSVVLFYLLGVSVETGIFATIYVVLPVGKVPLRRALTGGLFAAAIWEILRHVLVWYFTTLSKASVVYGSLTTAVVALFSLEIIALLLLMGAQVISEYEQLCVASKPD